MLECEHGQLARACNICEYEREIEELKQRISDAQVEIGAKDRENEELSQRFNDQAVSFQQTRAELDGAQKDNAALRAEVERLRSFITPIENECWIGKDYPGYEGRKWDQCCCQCKYLLVDYWYCRRMPKELKEEGHCGCEKIRGYICTVRDIHDVKSGQSGWPHHSIGCECFTKRDIAQAALRKEEG
jgi:polyhydroxyalkanoate synthesis regulator phasin